MKFSQKLILALAAGMLTLTAFTSCKKEDPLAGTWLNTQNITEAYDQSGKLMTLDTVELSREELQLGQMKLQIVPGKEKGSYEMTQMVYRPDKKGFVSDDHASVIRLDGKTIVHDLDADFGSDDLEYSFDLTLEDGQIRWLTTINLAGADSKSTFIFDKVEQ